MTVKRKTDSRQAEVLRKGRELREALNTLETAAVQLFNLADESDDIFAKAHRKVESVLIELSGGMYQKIKPLPRRRKGN